MLPIRLPTLATSGTPAWTIILVAALTGLFGVASGAGMAAFLTVRHETAERLRDRMIKAADDFVVAVIQAFGSLNRLERIAGQAASAPGPVLEGEGLLLLPGHSRSSGTADSLPEPRAPEPAVLSLSVK